MTYARRYGLDELRYVNNPMVDLALQQNTAPDRTIRSQLDLPDAMMRYQEEILNDRTPEKRPREDEQGGEEEVRERSRKIMNIHQYGDVRGDMDLAYKPEIEQIPQPYRNHKENKYNIFQRDKQVHARYGWRGEAQKDAMMQTINTDPKYKHSDTRKYIPGYIRTMPKTTIEDHVVPMHAKDKFSKPIQNFRNVENLWMLQYCKDSTRVEKPKAKIERHRKHSRKPHVDPIADSTNVNMMYKFVGGKYEKTGALRPDPQISGDDKLATFKKARPRPSTKHRQYINPGTITGIGDLVKITEKVNTIQKAAKKAVARRPTLEYATTERAKDDTTTAEFAAERPKPTRGNTFIIHPGLENITDEPDKTQKVAEKEKRKPWKQNRNTGYEISEPMDGEVGFRYELPKITKGSIRAFVSESDSQNENVAGTVAKHHKTQKNLTKFTEGYDLSDSTQERGKSRKHKRGVPEHRLGRAEENISYDDKVAVINSDRFEQKARNEQNRTVHPDMIIVENDPVANIGMSRPRLNITSDDKKQFITTEYMLQRHLNADV